MNRIDPETIRKSILMDWIGADLVHKSILTDQIRPVTVQNSIWMDSVETKPVQKSISMNHVCGGSTLPATGAGDGELNQRRNFSRLNARLGKKGVGGWSQRPFAIKHSYRPSGTGESRASVLECGGAPPLFHPRRLYESARALAQSKTSRQRLKPRPSNENAEHNSAAVDSE